MFLIDKIEYKHEGNIAVNDFFLFGLFFLWKFVDCYSLMIDENVNSFIQNMTK